MPVIRLETPINAPPERCFDLARDVDVHAASVSRTGERAVAGVTSGLLGPGDAVTWEAVHFGVRQRLTARITRFERPLVFEDEMVRGAFHSFSHTHEFRPAGAGTLMVDTFRYQSPLGVLGTLADKLFLERYMRSFLADRAAFLKRIAEATKSSSH
jgi:ligand-binding SRPBCC domain-containing protein